MIIDNNLLEKVLGIRIQEEILCENIGLITNDKPLTFTFLDDEKYFEQLINNRNIKAILITTELASKLDAPGIKKIICDDPRFYFYSLLNYLGQCNYQKKHTFIHPTSKIHRRAYVSEYNVQIGPNVVCEPGVMILPDVIIGENCIIRAGAVVGSEGFEHKRTSRGIVSVFHDGMVTIGRNVVIGANNTIAKGFHFRHTIIGDETKLDNLIHIAHGDQIGKRCFVAASAMIAGSVTMGDDVWIGPGASISSGITIGNKAHITIGSVVTKDVGPGQTVTGNFAIPHDKFIDNLKKSLM